MIFQRKPRHLLTGRTGLAIIAAIAVGCAGCSSAGAPNSASSSVTSTAPVQKPSAAPAPDTQAATPPVPSSRDIENGKPLGVSVLTYAKGIDRDWDDIDKWYAKKGKKRHDFNGQPRVHRVIGGNRNPDQQSYDLDKLLESNIVIENDPAAGDGVLVMAHHNITRLHSNAVTIDGKRYEEPLMGIHAPEMPGDVFTWYVQWGDRVAQYDYKATSVQIIPDADGEYAKLFEPLPSGKPLLVTYQCHPSGSLAERRVVRHELVDSKWVDTKIEWVK